MSARGTTETSWRGHWISADGGLSGRVETTFRGPGLTQLGHGQPLNDLGLNSHPATRPIPDILETWYP
jgi:hypothetical protein